MKKITYDVTSNKLLYLGNQYDHNATEIVFEGYEIHDQDNALYIQMEGLGRYPIPELKMMVCQPFTIKHGNFDMQIIEMSEDKKEVYHSEIFVGRVMRSLDEPKDIVERTPDFDYWFERFFKGEPGDPGPPGATPVKGEDYFTDEEIEEIKESVRYDDSRLREDLSHTVVTDQSDITSFTRLLIQPTSEQVILAEKKDLDDLKADLTNIREMLSGMDTVTEEEKENWNAKVTAFRNAEGALVLTL